MPDALQTISIISSFSTFDCSLLLPLALPVAEMRGGKEGLRGGKERRLRGKERRGGGGASISVIQDRQTSKPVVKALRLFKVNLVDREGCKGIILWRGFR